MSLEPLAEEAQEGRGERHHDVFVDQQAEGEDHDRTESLFHAARELPWTSRSAFLDRACAGKAELRREIEELLTLDLVDKLYRAARELPSDERASFLELGCDGLGEASQDVELFGDVLPSGERTPGLVARATDGTLVLLDVEHLSFAMQARIAAFAKDPHVRIVATTSASWRRTSLSGPR